MKAFIVGDLGYPWQWEGVQWLQMNVPEYSGVSEKCVPDKFIARPDQQPHLDPDAKICQQYPWLYIPVMAHLRQMVDLLGQQSLRSPWFHPQPPQEKLGSATGNSQVATLYVVSYGNS